MSNRLPLTTHDPEIVTLIDALGIDRNSTSKVILVIDTNGPVKVITQGYMKADGGTIAAVERLTSTIMVDKEKDGVAGK